MKFIFSERQRALLRDLLLICKIANRELTMLSRTKLALFLRGFRFRLSLENAARVLDLRLKTCRPVVDDAPRRKQKKPLVPRVVQS